MKGLDISASNRKTGNFQIGRHAGKAGKIVIIRNRRRSNRAGSHADKIEAGQAGGQKEFSPEQKLRKISSGRGIGNIQLQWRIKLSEAQSGEPEPRCHAAGKALEIDFDARTAGMTADIPADSFSGNRLRMEKPGNDSQGKEYQGRNH